MKVWLPCCPCSWISWTKLQLDLFLDNSNYMLIVSVKIHRLHANNKNWHNELLYLQIPVETCSVYCHTRPAPQPALFPLCFLSTGKRICSVATRWRLHILSYFCLPLHFGPLCIRTVWRSRQAFGQLCLLRACHRWWRHHVVCRSPVGWRWFVVPSVPRQSTDLFWNHNVRSRCHDFSADLPNNWRWTWKNRQRWQWNKICLRLQLLANTSRSLNSYFESMP